MAASLLLLLLLAVFCIFLLYAVIKKARLTNKRNLLFISINLLLILLLLIVTGTKQLKNDIATIIYRSSPKKPAAVYSLLFQQPPEGCVHFIHFKDQLIPKIDCCIWMDVKVCPGELSRICKQKNYTATTVYSRDAAIFLKPFEERPVWWTPQILGDSFARMHIKFNQYNEQTLFFGKDSSQVFICDQAL